MQVMNSQALNAKRETRLARYGSLMTKSVRVRGNGILKALGWILQALSAFQLHGVNPVGVITHPNNKPLNPQLPTPSTTLTTHYPVSRRVAIRASE